MKFLFNFKRQFADDVQSGRKTRTIRPNRKDGRRPVSGDIACCYTGLRTRSSRLLREAPVERCRAIRISGRDLIVDGRLLSYEEKQEFARADGFATLEAFFQFFLDQYGGSDFDGFCTEWS